LTSCPLPVEGEFLLINMMKLTNIIAVMLLGALVLPFFWAPLVMADSINFQVTVVKTDFSGWANVRVEVWNDTTLLAAENTNSDGDAFLSLPVGGPYTFRAGNASTTALVSGLASATLVGVILMPTAIDVTPPTSTITSPAQDASLNSLTQITGTANDASGVQKVEVSIKRNSDNQYWNGSSWVAGQTWLLAQGTTSWSYSLTPDSDGSYTIQSRAIDNSNNQETPAAGNTFTFDTTPPNDPSNVQSPSHTPSVWSKDNTVDVTWTDATDNLSGLDGYSILWDTSPNTIPPQTKNIEEGIQTTTSPALPDGRSHYFHIRSKDNAGNWRATVHLGPFFIRTLASNFVTKTTNPGDETVDNKAGADTEVRKSGAGMPTVTVAKYSSNPGSGFSGDVGKYVDVYIDSDAGIDEIEIKLYYTDYEIAGLDESSLRLNWWNGSSWVACSDSGVNMAENYIWAKIRSKTTPNLNQLTGTPFGGEGSPLLLIPTLTWTGTIAMVALLGGLFGFMLRRRLVSRFSG